MVLRHFWELFTGGDIAYAPDLLRIALRTDHYRHYRATAVATLDHDRPLLQAALHELGRLSEVGPFTGPLAWTPVEPTPLYADESVRLLMSQPGPPGAAAAAAVLTEPPFSGVVVWRKALTGPGSTRCPAPAATWAGKVGPYWPADVV
ncbi:MAG: hypothetical protein ACRYG2_32890 [Janthinobacterium lividum]